jgi:hypothetical protein
MEGRGRSKWSPGESINQWSQIPITFKKSWIQVRIEVKSWIRIRTEVRIRNPARIILYKKIKFLGPEILVILARYVFTISSAR